MVKITLTGINNLESTDLHYFPLRKVSLYWIGAFGRSCESDLEVE